MRKTVHVITVVLLPCWQAVLAGFSQACEMLDHSMLKCFKC